jgi:hypothetical protein
MVSLDRALFQQTLFKFNISGFGDVLGDESGGMVAFSHSSQGQETRTKRKKSFSLWA